MVDLEVIPDINIELTSGVMQVLSPPDTIEIGTYTFNWNGERKIVYC